MNKPAATIYHNGKMIFYFWPRDISQKKMEKYVNTGVRIVNRGLDAIDHKKNKNNSQLVLIHTIRSTDLANLIISNLDDVIKELGVPEDYELYIATEGLSYSSVGDATLNLATYKGVLLSKIYEHYGSNLKRLYTYSPITMKSIAGCANKECRGDKLAMIKAFCSLSEVKSPFKDAIVNEDLILKKNFVEGVDDLVDSFWAFKTMIIKENLSTK